MERKEARDRAKGCLNSMHAHLSLSLCHWLHTLHFCQKTESPSCQLQAEQGAENWLRMGRMLGKQGMGAKSQEMLEAASLGFE